MHSLAELRLPYRLLTLVSLALIDRCGLELPVRHLTLCQVFCGESMLKCDGALNKTCFNFSVVKKFPDDLSTSDRSQQQRT